MSVLALTCLIICISSIFLNEEIEKNREEIRDLSDRLDKLEKMLETKEELNERE